MEPDFRDELHGMLRKFDAGEWLQGEIGFSDRLKALDYDYSPAAVERVDGLLREIRREVEVPYLQFIQTPANGRFLIVVAALVAETVGLYLGTPCRWGGRDRIAALWARDKPREAPPPGSFGTSIVCEMDGTGYWLPLSAVEACIFQHEAPPVPLIVCADRFMQRSTAPRVPRPPSGRETSTDIASDGHYLLGRTAGRCASMCVESALKHGSSLAPMLFQEDAGLFVQWIDLTFHEALERGRAWLERPEIGVVRQALAHDALVRLEAYRPDALVIDAAATAAAHGPGLRVRFALPYRSAQDGFALHALRVPDFSGSAQELARLASGFFAGLEEVVPLWDRHFEDESADGNVAIARRNRLARRSWQAATDSRETSQPFPPQDSRSERDAAPDQASAAPDDAMASHALGVPVAADRGVEPGPASGSNELALARESLLVSAAALGLLVLLVVALVAVMNIANIHVAWLWLCAMLLLAGVTLAIGYAIGVVQAMRTLLRLG